MITLSDAQWATSAIISMEAEYLVSLMSPKDMGETPSGIDPANHIRLDMDDIEAPVVRRHINWTNHPPSHYRFCVPRQTASICRNISGGFCIIEAKILPLRIVIGKMAVSRYLDEIGCMGPVFAGGFKREIE